MIIVTNLRADVATGDFDIGRVAGMVAESSVAGMFRKVAYGLNGVSVSWGAYSVVLPMESIIKLAESVEPGLSRLPGAEAENTTT